MAELVFITASALRDGIEEAAAELGKRYPIERFAIASYRPERVSPYARGMREPAMRPVLCEKTVFVDERGRHEWAYILPAGITFVADR